MNCNFLLSSPTFYRIWKKKSVEEFQAYPYLATVLNCLMWIMYGLPVVHPDSTLVVSINGFGLVVELIYLSLYFTYAPKNGRLARVNDAMWHDINE
ncbi:hypothetical protein CRG98_024509 [Punica granatum]|uniref:Uncharacterized protein n=1 Tax=Punica granatum TaxID=22663 RepID=A0A2I0JG65_PUNGR|nr:hypothetical protein CRG98_024509 [Punica granatum]